MRFDGTNTNVWGHKERSTAVGGREGEDERLVVGCADGSLAFFSASGTVLGQHVPLGSSITALAPFPSGAAAASCIFLTAARHACLVLLPSQGPALRN